MEAFATSQVRENEQTSGEQVSGAGSARHAVGGPRKMLAVWQAGEASGRRKRDPTGAGRDAEAFQRPKASLRVGIPCYPVPKLQAAMEG